MRWIVYKLHSGRHLGNFRVLFPRGRDCDVLALAVFCLLKLTFVRKKRDQSLSFFRPVKGRGIQSLPVSFAGPFRAGYPSATASGLLPRDVSFSKRSYSRTRGR